MKTITLKLTKFSFPLKKFSLKLPNNEYLLKDKELDVTEDVMRFEVDNSVSFLVLEYSDDSGCFYEKVLNVNSLPESEIANILNKPAEKVFGSSFWVHGKDKTLFNRFYGRLDPYVLEMVFYYTVKDEILQGIIDYSRVYKYVGNSGEPDRISVEDAYFNKSIIYNDEQCSGIIVLNVPKKNDMRERISYPKYKEDRKEISVYKSDSLYLYNTFWSVTINKSLPNFVKSCTPYYVDKELNQANMDYSRKDFKKERIRGKYVKVRHILDNREDLHIVSSITITENITSHR